MEMITTHLGADFDAYGSVLMARRLHPAAKIFFPGSKEESVRRFEEGPLGQELAALELKHKDVDPAEVTRLVLCDVVQPDRIGIVADWLRANPAIEVWAYDHHEPDEESIATRGGVVDPGAGSTCTLLAEILTEQGERLSAHEATLLLLGIYEDTGSLAYAGTGARDLRAAARLLELGADLTAVRHYALQRLDPSRFDILHRMTEALEMHRIRGHRLGTLALELGDYVDELAPLVNRTLEIFELPMLFALFGEGDRVTLIARGDQPGVHLGDLMEELADGGGHATAASARLKGVTPLEARENLLAFLERSLPPAARASDLMVTSFFTLGSDRTVAEAKEALIERRVNAAPVVDRRDRVVGVITRQTLDGALQHGLGDRPVDDGGPAGCGLGGPGRAGRRGGGGDAPATPSARAGRRPGERPSARTGHPHAGAPAPPRSSARRGLGGRAPAGPPAGGAGPHGRPAAGAVGAPGAPSGSRPSPPSRGATRSRSTWWAASCATCC